MYLIKINETYWKANYVGVGQITTYKDRARRYKTAQGAKIGLARMRKYKPYSNAKVAPELLESNPAYRGDDNENTNPAC